MKQFWTVVFCLLIVPNRVDAQDDPFAPEPTVVPYHKSKRKDDQKLFTKPAYKPTSTKTLENYEPGKNRHHFLLNHCNSILTLVERYENEGKKITAIYLKGFADGLPNTKSDLELADSRATIYKELLFEQLKEKGYYPIIKFLEPYDEPDNGKTGGKYRKVEISFEFNR